jgi:heterodisulfide reductase subunit B
MKVGFYPGCSLEGSSREYAESLRAIAPIIGLDLAEVPDWNCCGASAAHNLNHKLSLALPARVLALAEKAGLDELLVPCSACYARLAMTRHELLEKPELAKEIQAVIELPLTGRTRVLNAVQVLHRLIVGATASNGLAKKVTKPFAHKVACYYGCYMTRPTQVSSCARIEDPREMDELMKAVGAAPIDWAFKVECCGAALSVTRLDVVADLSGRIVEDAVRRGAEAIVVACPMCHTNLDLRRSAIVRSRRVNWDIPVLYVSQVIGLALGLSERSLGLHRHAVKMRLVDKPAPAAETKIA